MYNRYRPISAAVLQKKFGRTLCSIQAEIGPGQHRPENPEMGKALDKAQLLVEDFDRNTAPASRSATRTRRENTMVERSLVGQQPAFGTEGNGQRILPPVAPCGAGTNASPNPFTPPNSNNNRPVAPRHEDATHRPALGSTPGTAIPINDTHIDEARRHVAENVRRSMRSIRRMQANHEPTGNAARRLFDNEQILQHCANFIDPLNNTLRRAVETREIDSIMGLNRMIAENFDRSIERMRGTEQAQQLIRERDEFERDSQRNILAISRRIQGRWLDRVVHIDQLGGSVQTQPSAEDEGDNLPDDYVDLTEESKEAAE